MALKCYMCGERATRGIPQPIVQRLMPLCDATGCRNDLWMYLMNEDDPGADKWHEQDRKRLHEQHGNTYTSA